MYYWRACEVEHLLRYHRLGLTYFLSRGGKWVKVIPPTRGHLMTHAIVALLLILTLADKVYVPETVDSLATSTHKDVQVAGSVAALSLKSDGTIDFRLCNQAFHCVNCVLPPGQAQPRLGVQVIVSGTRKVYSLLEHTRVVELLVERLEPIE